MRFVLHAAQMPPLRGGGQSRRRASKNASKISYELIVSDSDESIIGEWLIIHSNDSFLDYGRMRILEAIYAYVHFLP